MSAMVGAGLGLGASAGVLLAVVRTPILRRPTLADRLDPYLRDSARPSRLLQSDRTLTPFPALERVLAPLVKDGVRMIERALGGSGSVRRRLGQAGRDLTVEEFRAEQLLWGAGGLAGSLVLAMLAWLSGRGSTVPLALLCGLCAVGGVLVRDKWLSHEVAVREERIIAEFPTIAELLALSVAAGEGAVGSLERVSRISTGELAAVLGSALDRAHAGMPLTQALDDVARRTSVPALSRFLDGVVVAIERGTPLAEVLRAQAIDVREAGKRALLETGGRKEVAMMIPVVFLIMPVTVVFALFPGFLSLSFSG